MAISEFAFVVPTIFGTAVFSCVRFWNCCVNAAPQFSLNPVNDVPSSFGDS